MIAFLLFGAQLCQMYQAQKDFESSATKDQEQALNQCHSNGDISDLTVCVLQGCFVGNNREDEGIDRCQWHGILL
jgi:hypothetical protein